MDVHDITKLLQPGTNVVAIKATNTDAGAAGLVARVIIKEKGGTFESYLDRRHVAHERQGIRQLDAAERPRQRMAARPRSTARWAACCRGATKSSSPTKARGS